MANIDPKLDMSELSADAEAEIESLLTTSDCYLSKSDALELHNLIIKEYHATYDETIDYFDDYDWYYVGFQAAIAALSFSRPIDVLNVFRDLYQRAKEKE